jgi:hypothetical protein
VTDILYVLLRRQSLSGEHSPKFPNFNAAGKESINIFARKIDFRHVADMFWARLARE